jgi:guanylate kinase
MGVLEYRLRARGTDNDDQIFKRISNAESEEEYFKIYEEKGWIHKTFVNKELNTFLKEAEEYIMNDLYKFN